jgi:hypothetical protein
VEPVAVIDFAPPLVSATMNGPDESVQEPYDPVLLPVGHVKDVVVKAVSDAVTVSAEPKPLAVSDPETDCSGKP